MSPQSIPPELNEWVQIRQDLIAKALRKSRYDLQKEDPKQWCLDLLKEMTHIERVAKRTIYLLTAYAAREHVARASEVAFASDVTISSAMSRGGSKLAQEVWNELQTENKKNASGGG